MSRPRPALLIVAHPDDEVIGAGVLLSRLRDPVIVQITNGAPAGADPEYARVRDTEARRALDLARPGVPRFTFDVAEKRASFEMIPLVERLRSLFLELRPRLVLTHPYEGGHPDHDAVALAVHLAAPGLGILPGEFTSYHWREDQLVTGQFLPDGPRVRTWRLNERERALRRAMLNAHESQRALLEDFADDVERFRMAPAYDFTKPPHEGRLFYEHFDFGLDGAAWRERAAVALSRCRIPRSGASGATART